MLSLKTIISLTLMGILSGASLQAAAVPATCQSLGIQNNVTSNDGCQIGSTNNDTLGSGPIQVNTDQMFGFSDWTFAEKGFEQEQNIDVGLFIFGSAQAGIWWIDQAIWNVYSDVMLVLKGGSGNTNPANYVGYLLEDGQSWGSYLSPFMNGSKRKDISHFSIYVRGAERSVPEPTTLALIGLGLVGLAYLRRRRS
jgi:hypothetical protein